MAKKQSHKERSDADRRVRQCERLARLMQVLHFISGHGRWDADALAEELECSTRTIHRLLQTLSVAGVPWFFDDRTKSYAIRPGYKFPLLDADSAENEVVSQQAKSVSKATEKLLKEGEAFAAALDAFLQAIRKSEHGGQ